MKLNFKNLTIAATLFGTLAFSSTLFSTVTLGHPMSLPQNDIDKEASGAFDSHKSTDRYLKAPANTKARTDDKINKINSTVTSVQKALSELDYGPGPADGIMGANTMAALAKFQRDNEITPTGRLNAETLEALEINNRLMYEEDFNEDVYAE